jgi:hypothetical protein
MYGLYLSLLNNKFIKAFINSLIKKKLFKKDLLNFAHL